MIKKNTYLQLFIIILIILILLNISHTIVKIPIVRNFKDLLSYNGNIFKNKIAILIPIYEKDYHFLEGIFVDILNNLDKLLI